MSQSTFSDRKELLYVVVSFVIGCLAFLPGLGSYPILDPTDSFFAEVGREMVSTGYYTTALFNYAPWFDKPVFAFWLIAGSDKLFGYSAWASRFPSALSGILLVVATFVCTRRLVNSRVAFMAASILASTPIFLLAGHNSLTDEPLCLSIGLTMLLMAEVLIKGNRNSAFFAYIALSVALLIKGPIALILVAGSLSIYIVIQSWTDEINRTLDEKKKLVKAIWTNVAPLRLWLGFLVLMLLVVPWYVYVHVATHGAFTQEFFFHQNLGRFQGNVNHQEPIWWYIPIYFGGYFPWSILLLFACLFLIDQSRNFWQSDNSRLIVYCLVWTGFTLTLFTLVPTKLWTYILPISPAIAILTACYLDWVLEIGKGRVLAGSGEFLIIAALGGCLIIHKLSAGHTDLIYFAYGMVLSMVLGLVRYCYLLGKNKVQLAVQQFLLTMYIGFVALTPTLLCIFYWGHQSMIDRLIMKARRDNAQLATLFCTIPSAIAAYGEKIQNVSNVETLEAYLSDSNDKHYLFTSRELSNFDWFKQPAKLVDRDRKWFLYELEYKRPADASKHDK